MKYQLEKKNTFFQLHQIFYFVSYKVLSSITEKYKRPLICSFKITSRCNLKCVHCPFWRLDEEKKDMEFEKIKLILKKLNLLGVRIVIFEGGEPMLWKDQIGQNKKDITDVINYAKELFFYVCVTTNGTVNFSSAATVADIMFVSIDGLQKTHDKIRGKSFENIIKNIEISSKLKKVIVNICISRINIEEISQMVKFLNDKVYGITIQFFYPYNNVTDYMLSPKQKENILREIVALKRTGFKILNSYACLEKMANNTWQCNDFLVCSVENNGLISQGCYLKNKVSKISCRDCGFAVHCEISLAYRLNLSAIKTAFNIFWKKQM